VLLPQVGMKAQALKAHLLDQLEEEAAAQAAGGYGGSAAAGRAVLPHGAALRCATMLCGAATLALCQAACLLPVSHKGAGARARLLLLLLLLQAH
jgi:hypothetical protein